MIKINKKANKSFFIRRNIASNFPRIDGCLTFYPDNANILPGLQEAKNRDCPAKIGTVGGYVN